jgi:hypothetical protein
MRGHKNVVKFHGLIRNFSMNKSEDKVGLVNYCNKIIILFLFILFILKYKLK